MDFIKKYWEIDETILRIAKESENTCLEKFSQVDKIAAENSAKVLNAFIESKVTAQSLQGSTGYGYGDIGRDTIDSVFAKIFGSDDALVRHNFVSGTHAISTALFGILRPRDNFISVTGSPYDTLMNIIKKSPNGKNGSLEDIGIEYSEVDLLENGQLNFEMIHQKSKEANVIYFQRSKGYSLRPAFTISDIKKTIQIVKQANHNSIVIIDNCYGEFVENLEPTDVGADLVIGSLIKNPGGGIARTGGYICGRPDLIEQCAYRLTTIGMGKDIGCTLDMNRELLLGVYFSPNIVANALKIGYFASEFFKKLGFETFPKADEPRGDIVVAIKLGSELSITTFCKSIQQTSAVDSHLTPLPWNMPGYNCKVIMAAGAFTNGSSIELSADAPIRPPYAVWLQGGTNYTNGIIALLNCAQLLKSQGLITL